MKRLALFALSLAGCVAVKAWVGIHPPTPWLPVSGSSVRYIAFAGWDGGTLIGPAVHQAELELATTRGCDVAKLEPVYFVTVMPTQSWLDGYGRLVGGETVGTSSQVTVSLDSLLHEMRHACEYQQLGGPDSAHAAWWDAGVWPADLRYRGWLRDGGAA